MTNASVIARMNELLSRFQSGALTVFDVEAQFSPHMSALEKVSSAQVDRSRDLIHALVLANIEEERDEGDLEKALENLRGFLAELPM